MYAMTFTVKSYSQSVEMKVSDLFNSRYSHKIR